MKRVPIGVVNELITMCCISKDSYDKPSFERWSINATGLEMLKDPQGTFKRIKKLLDLPWLEQLGRRGYQDWSKSSVERGREACNTETGKLALYHLVGLIATLPSYGLRQVQGKDILISRKQVLDLIRDAGKK